MDFEQKYKDIIKMAREAYYSPETPHIAKAWLLTMFPTIAESEDERIRKEFYKDLRTYIPIEKTNEYIAWLEKQRQDPRKVSIWKHWKHGICGNGEGKQIYLIKMGNTYSLSSCLGFECDYIELSELDNLMLEKQDKKTNPYSGMSFEYNGHIWGMCARDNGVDILLDKQLFKHLEQQSEQTYAEIAESKDERIRKWIITQLEGMSGSTNIDRENEIVEAIDWLEKQGKQTNAKLGQSEVTKTSDQEPSVKVEPKFKVRDWLQYRSAEPFFVEEITKQGYVNGDSCLPFEWEDEIHLWTIQDAKDGDVLVYVTDEENLWIMIYWSLYEPYDGHVHYHALLVNDNFTDKGTCCICIDNLKPATKEQRDLLFQKMADAGYEWDAEKKKLKKVESKTSLL